MCFECLQLFMTWILWGSHVSSTITLFQFRLIQISPILQHRSFWCLYMSARYKHRRIRFHLTNYLTNYHCTNSIKKKNEKFKCMHGVKRRHKGCRAHWARVNTLCIISWPAHALQGVHCIFEWVSVFIWGVIDQLKVCLRAKLTEQSEKQSASLRSSLPCTDWGSIGSLKISFNFLNIYTPIYTYTIWQDYGFRYQQAFCLHYLILTEELRPYEDRENRGRPYFKVLGQECVHRGGFFFFICLSCVPVLGWRRKSQRMQTGPWNQWGSCLRGTAEASRSGTLGRSCCSRWGISVSDRTGKQSIVKQLVHDMHPIIFTWMGLRIHMVAGSYHFGLKRRLHFSVLQG